MDSWLILAPAASSSSKLSVTSYPGGFISYVKSDSTLSEPLLKSYSTNHAGTIGQYIYCEYDGQIPFKLCWSQMNTDANRTTPFVVVQEAKDTCDRIIMHIYVLKKSNIDVVQQYPQYSWTWRDENIHPCVAASFLYKYSDPWHLGVGLNRNYAKHLGDQFKFDGQYLPAANLMCYWDGVSPITNTEGVAENLITHGYLYQIERVLNEKERTRLYEICKKYNESVTTLT